MGLEWEPLPTPKRGYEREFVDLFKKLIGARGPKREQIVTWFANVSDPPFTTLGAPRVGHDESADEWLRARLEKADRLAELEQIKIEMHGHCVLELLPPCEGFPVYSNYKVNEDLDRYSFPAELLAVVSDALGIELWERAHQMMLPEEHQEYAVRLYETADKFSQDHDLPPHVATIREPVYPEGSIERRGHILYAAAKWCAYWSQRGHGLALAG